MIPPGANFPLQGIRHRHHKYPHSIYADVENTPLYWLSLFYMPRDDRGTRTFVLSRSLVRLLEASVRDASR